MYASNTTYGSRVFITEIETLKEHVSIDNSELDCLKKVTEKHPMKISNHYLSLVDDSNPDDPIWRMAIPSCEELDPSGLTDTSGEVQNTILPGLQHKYPQTALMLVTDKCFLHCRHCFRKRMVGKENDEILKDLDAAVEYIKRHPEINNVLITGGDSMCLSTAKIRDILESLNEIENLRFIRFGTRSVVTYPQRFLDDQELVELLGEHSRPERRIYINTHVNHALELSSEAVEVVDMLISAGVLINNQTVLLKGVNDDPSVMAELQNSLSAIGIIPYYVFQCRPVSGAGSHFQVPLHKGLEILDGAKALCNGHSKRFRYIMSHWSGKIEIVGALGREVFFKYHQARRKENNGMLFKKSVSEADCWLGGSLEPVMIS